jgi:protein TonB
MEGELINRIEPEYPSLARTARQQGMVLIEATIGVDGTIQDLRVITGPPLLRQAAVDAVSRWRYRPYLLNGQAVPVTTTVSVNFVLQ